VLPQATTAPAIQAPRTASELQAVMQQRTELEAQIRSLSESQERLFTQRQIRFGDGDQAGAREFDARLKEVNARLARLEDQKLAADDAISQALARGINQVDVPPPAELPPSVPFPGFPLLPDQSILTSEQIQDIRTQVGKEYERLMILEGVVIVLLGAFAWRFWFRRAIDRIRSELGGAPQSQRELRDAVDAIALEVERISENQRFVTKLLAEQPAPEPLQRADARPR
jgi:hypothetical protein